MKSKRLAQAYDQATTVRNWLHTHARCMECTEDKAGILWERWLLPNNKSVFLCATFRGWEITRPVTDDQYIDKTITALAAYAGFAKHDTCSCCPPAGLVCSIDADGSQTLVEASAGAMQ